MMAEYNIEVLHLLGLSNMAADYHSCQQIVEEGERGDEKVPAEFVATVQRPGPKLSNYEQQLLDIAIFLEGDQVQETVQKSRVAIKRGAKEVHGVGRDFPPYGKGWTFSRTVSWPTCGNSGYVPL